MMFEIAPSPLGDQGPLARCPVRRKVSRESGTQQQKGPRNCPEPFRRSTGESKSAKSLVFRVLAPVLCALSVSVYSLLAIIETSSTVRLL